MNTSKALIQVGEKIQDYTTAFRLMKSDSFNPALFFLKSDCHN